MLLTLIILFTGVVIIPLLLAVLSSFAEEKKEPMTQRNRIDMK